MPWRKDRFCWDALVLAGGRSLRMGRDKSTLEVEGVPLLELQVRRARQAGAEALWVACAPGATRAGDVWDGVAWLPDELAGAGPWPGLRAALQASLADALLVLAVDLPALTPGFLKQLLRHASPGIGCIPGTPGGLEPLCAVYPLPVAVQASEAIAREMEPSPRRLAEHGLRHGWMRRLTVPEADLGKLVNWNRPDDWSGTSERRGDGEADTMP